MTITLIAPWRRASFTLQLNVAIRLLKKEANVQNLHLTLEDLEDSWDHSIPRITAYLEQAEHTSLVTRLKLDKRYAFAYTELAQLVLRPVGQTSSHSQPPAYHGGPFNPFYLSSVPCPYNAVPYGSMSWTNPQTHLPLNGATSATSSQFFA
ncbi:hypothetical protein CY34DRAFT_17682 [Suillus luteus UH-Slu-Lm8-n1]|uniref:Uncharacterized protein n=1 Tax=Suillus luteus UH-Slu-Lm8-n1 TaxID=930992 RepID=A0A0D0AJV2_9AGAM|nr:hypothetical protein CY34DRAFT_17682 [Suillus luteus UH-Slu-Lm8-n1]